MNGFHPVCRLSYSGEFVDVFLDRVLHSIYAWRDNVYACHDIVMMTQMICSVQNENVEVLQYTLTQGACKTFCMIFDQ